jgi:uncharacterized membrane protein YfcA
MTLALAILFGAVVGVSLGLTGGGGGILAVPMLVYGVGVEPHQALLVSLLAVGATALVGAIERIRRNEVAVATGVLFAVAGMAGAPYGATLADRIEPRSLLLMFSALMLYVALRMWFKAGSRRPTAGGAHPPLTNRARRRRSTFSLGRVIMLVVLGAATGVLSGLFGVGGGFVIVPALVLVGGMDIHRAVATSLLVIPLVSVTGVAQHLRQQQQPLALGVTVLFVVGGVAGMAVGTFVGRRMSAARLQRVFAVVIIVVAAFNVFMTLREGNRKASEPGKERADRHVLPPTIHPGSGDRFVHGRG